MSRNLAQCMARAKSPRLAVGQSATLGEQSMVIPRECRRLKDGLAYFDGKDLQNLGTGEAIVRMERAEYDFNLRTMPLATANPQSARARREAVIEKSRA